MSRKVDSLCHFMRYINLIEIVCYLTGVAITLDAQPQADAKGYNQFFLAATGAHNIGFEPFVGIYMYTGSATAGIKGYEIAHISKLELEVFDSIQCVRCDDLLDLIDAENAKHDADEDDDVERTVFFTLTLYDFLEPKIRIVDQLEEESDIVFESDKERRKWRLQEAALLHIGVYDLLSPELYEVLLFAPLHIILRSVDKLALMLSVSRRLFGRQPLQEIAFIMSEMPMEGSKLLKRSEAISMQKNIKCSFTGAKANAALALILPICTITAGCIDGNLERDEYQRFVNVLFLFLFERIIEFIVVMYADITLSCWNTRSSRWIQIMERGRSTIQTLYRHAAWLLTPTIIKLFTAVPQLLYSLRLFNERHGTQLTIRDFDDNVFEHLNSDAKKFASDHHFRGTVVESTFDSSLQHFVLTNHGGLDVAAWSLHSTPSQKRALERDPIKVPFDISKLDDHSQQMVRALRAAEDVVPFISHSETMRNIKKIAELIATYDEHDVVVQAELEEDEAKSAESSDAVDSMTVPQIEQNEPVVRNRKKRTFNEIEDVPSVTTRPKSRKKAKRQRAAINNESE